MADSKTAKYTEEQVNQAIGEYELLSESLKPIWRLLVTEGMKTAKQRGLETRVVDIDETIFLDAPVVIRRDGENVDTSELIDLARDRYPEEYKTYQIGIKRHSELTAELEKMRVYFSKLPQYPRAAP